MDPGSMKDKPAVDSVRVCIETSSWTIVGTVHPPSPSYRSRLSDLLNQKDITFLSVTDAAVYRSDDLAQPAYSAPYMAVNIQSIEVVRPLEE